MCILLMAQYPLQDDSSGSSSCWLDWAGSVSLTLWDLLTLVVNTQLSTAVPVDPPKYAGGTLAYCIE